MSQNAGSPYCLSSMKIKKKKKKKLEIKEKELSQIALTIKLGLLHDSSSQTEKTLIRHHEARLLYTICQK